MASGQIRGKQPYGKVQGDSGVTAFEPGDDYIDVWFRSEETPYRYSYGRAGKLVVEQMKWLARSGRGLATYINKNAHDLHDR